MSSGITHVITGRVRNGVVVLIGMALLYLLGQPAFSGDETTPITWQKHIDRKSVHADYPWITVDEKGVPWMVFVEHNGTSDVLKLASRTDGSLQTRATLAGPGMIHRPRIVHGRGNVLWVIWSQRSPQHRWELKAKQVVNGKPKQKTIDVHTVFSTNQIFPDAAVGPDGRLWIVWQAMTENGRRVRLRWFAPGTNKRSSVMSLDDNADVYSDWRPRIACGADGKARVVYESADDGDFDLKMATVGHNGSVQQKPVADTKSYEAFAEIASGPDGKRFYMTWERGKKYWGHNSRSHKEAVGLNSGKQIEVAYMKAGTDQIKSLPPIRPLIVNMVDGLEKAAATVFTVNEPQIAVDASGRPWLFVRWAVHGIKGVAHSVWKIAAFRYDPKRDQWSNPMNLSPSGLSQDRLCSVVRGEGNTLFVSWPSDRRWFRSTLDNTAVFLARINTEKNVSYPDELPKAPELAEVPHTQQTDIPESSRTDQKQVSHRGKTYSLYWGDTHRHTDLSPDRTIWDGTATEHFRYAYEVANLDFLATSDHTDIGPGRYHPYEWWQTQKISDYMTAPERFLGFYGYEREQAYPWGHRNVIFGEIGGPIVYIRRHKYRESQWQKQFPVKKGEPEIRPDELWDVLREAGKPVAVISHSPADRGMGTSWKKYDQIDHRVENTVEIFQGARISYEGSGAPQPTVGLDTDQSPDELKDAPNGGSIRESVHKEGTYQTALREGHRLGVIASSDHISTNTSFAGVYAERFTRRGILEAIRKRHTIAATDHIFLHYTCNGNLLGTAFKTDRKPELKIQLEGTAPVDRVTIIRNEENYKTFKLNGDATTFETAFQDPDPVEGENRYYIRVVQEDGNMAWASPVWVEYRP